MGIRSTKIQLNPEGGTSNGKQSDVDNSTEKSINNEFKIFYEIAKNLPPDKWKLFGLQLELDVIFLMDLEQTISKEGREFTIIRMLEKWKERQNPGKDQLIRLLVTALRAIDSHDVANVVEKKFPHGLRYPLDVFVENFQGALTNSFSNLKLSTTAWLETKCLLLDKLFVELTMRTNNKRGENENRIKREEIFNETMNGIPQRILIESNPGYGKTTLIAKLLSDWSNREKYITNRFHLVFVIALRNYKGNLSKYFLQHYEKVKGSEEEKLKVIEMIKDRVLLLLDGLEETPAEFKENLYRQITDDYQQMTVVATCRTGFVQLETKSEYIKGNGLEKTTFWDQRIQIQGISPEIRKEFLKNYLNIHDEELQAKICQVNLMNDLYQCPLFLLVLSILLQEKNIPKIRTKAELHKAMINFVFNKVLGKLKGKGTDVDVFNLTTDLDEYGIRNVLLSYGKLCLEKIKRQSFKLEESELIQCSDGNGDEDLVLQLGLLLKEISFFNYNEKEYYDPIHKSLIEFTAAFYLSSLDEMKTEIQELTLKFNIWPKDDELLFPFLGGLLDSNAFKLFNALSPYKSLISIFEDNSSELYNVEKILLEIPQTKEILKSLENLSIGNWQKIKYKESLRLWIDALMRERGEDIFLKIPENLDIINCVSDDIKIDTIQMDTREADISVTKGEINIKGRNIQCRNLKINMHEIQENSSEVLKEMLRQIKGERIWLKVVHSYMCNIYNLFAELVGEEFRHFNFYHLSLDNIPLEKFLSINSFIRDLIQRRKIEYGLKIKFSEDSIMYIPSEMNTFEEIIANSHLKSFAIASSFEELSPPVALPFPVAFFNNERQMQCMGLKGLFEGITNADEMKSLSVEHFHCFLLQLEYERFLPRIFLKLKNVKRLSCDNKLISDLGDCHYSSNWKGFETIDALDLYIQFMQDSRSFLKGISLFTSVRQICFYDFYDTDFIIAIITSLPSLRKIRFSSACNFPNEFLKRLFVLNDEAKGEGLKFEEIEIDLIEDMFYYCLSQDFIKCMEECFRRNIFLKFSILGDHHFDVQVLKHFLSKGLMVSSQWKQIPRFDALGELWIDDMHLDENPTLKHELMICLKSI